MTIRYFGEVAEMTGRSDETLEVQVSNPQDLKQVLLKRYQMDVSGMKLAVNHRLISWEDDLTIDNQDHIAVMSPFAGG